MATSQQNADQSRVNKRLELIKPLVDLKG